MGMSTRWWRAVTILATTLGATACGGPDPSPAGPGTVHTADPAKVDPSVLEAMARGESLSVIVLGRSQLLDRPRGLEAFQTTHQEWPRQALRTEVGAQLREIAAAEQAQIMSVLGETRRVRRLWIYNAVAGTLAPSEIATLSRLDGVAYVFANFGERVVFPRGSERASLVLAASPRRWCCQPHHPSRAGGRA